MRKDFTLQWDFKGKSPKNIFIFGSAGSLLLHRLFSFVISSVGYSPLSVCEFLMAVASLAIRPGASVVGSVAVAFGLYSVGSGVCDTGA